MIIAWPPQRLAPLVAEHQRQILDRFASEGVHEGRMLRTWIEIAREHLRQTSAPSRWKVNKVTGEVEKVGRARANTLLEKTSAVVNEFVLSANPAFSAAQRTIAGKLLLGHESRQKTRRPDGRLADRPGVRRVRHIMRTLETIGLVRIERRHEDGKHEDDEAHATLYLLEVPEKAFEAWRASRRRNGRASPTAPAGRPSTSHAAAPPRHDGARRPRGRSDEVASWWLPIAQELRRAKYNDAPGGPKNSVKKAELLGAIEGALRGAAADCRSWFDGTFPGVQLEERPRVEAIEQELARLTVGDWLANNTNAAAERHPLGWFRGDVEKLCGPAVARWKAETKPRAHAPAGAPVIVARSGGQEQRPLSDAERAQHARAALAHLRAQWAEEGKERALLHTPAQHRDRARALDEEQLDEEDLDEEQLDEEPRHQVDERTELDDTDAQPTGPPPHPHR